MMIMIIMINIVVIMIYNNNKYVYMYIYIHTYSVCVLLYSLIMACGLLNASADSMSFVCPRRVRLDWHWLSRWPLWWAGASKLTAAARGNRSHFSERPTICSQLRIHVFSLWHDVSDAWYYLIMYIVYIYDIHLHYNRHTWPPSSGTDEATSMALNHGFSCVAMFQPGSVGWWSSSNWDMFPDCDHHG